MSKKIYSYPRQIEGKPFVDPFFKHQPELQSEQTMIDLVNEVGLEEASKIMWSMYFVLDPRCFYSERKDTEDKMLHVTKQYYEMDWDSRYTSLKEFYLENILINDDIITYVILREQYHTDVRKGMSVKKAREEKEALDSYRDSCYAVLNSKKQTVLPGEKQLGRAQQRRNRK